MTLFEILLSWSSFMVTLLKMIRRLFTTFIDQSIPPADMQCVAHNAITGSFRVSGHESLNWLHAEAPCFPVCASKIQIIQEPCRFYETLARNCSTAKERIIMASLYLGIGELEKNLVANIQKNLQGNSKLKVNILLDFARGTRGEENSKSILMPLVKQTKNVTLSLYHTPSLRGISKKLFPPRWNELIGIQHMKLYLFDETVIISGANLSNDYFTNRQDRYLIIEDKRLADFYSNLVYKVQEFSFQVNVNAEIELHPKWNMLPYDSDKINFVTKARENIFNYFANVCEEQKYASTEKNADTWIFPLIEMGQLGIHHDSVVTKKLLSASMQNSKLQLASGYFNLTDDYMNTLTDNCLANCNILMAHPNANGFQGAKGMAGGIPAAYTLIARYFYKKLKEAGQDDRVKLFEYQKDGWSYHAKGLWYYLPGSDLPNLTLIGSSNFGERSVNRDLETQICMVTTNVKLQQELQSECENLFKLGSTAEQELVNRHVPKWVRAMVSLFRTFF